MNTPETRKQNIHDVNAAGPGFVIAHCCVILDRTALDVAMCRFCQERETAINDDILDAEYIED